MQQPSDLDAQLPGQVSATLSVTAATDRICAAIADEGCAVEADFLPRAAIAAGRRGAGARCGREFHAAGVGRGSARVQRSDVRGDRILWLDQGSAGPVQQPFWQALDTLRCALNETLAAWPLLHRSTLRACTRRAPSIAATGTSFAAARLHPTCA